MVFSFNITTPKSTLKNSPLVTDLEISKGVIHKWYILFPEGHWAENHIQITKGGDPILPINSDGTLEGNGSPFDGEEFIYIKSSPYILQAHTWNDDIYNDHTLYIRIFIKPLWTFMPYSEQLFKLMEEEEIAVVV